MGVFEQLPYTNMQNANLDWILRTIRDLENKIDENLTDAIAQWIEDNYNELFFNATYDASTETIIIAKGGTE